MPDDPPKRIVTQPWQDLRRFFQPDGVAIVGRIPREADGDTVRARYAQFGTRFYLVHPGGGSVGDVPVYRRVLDIPEPVDLAVITIPPEKVPQAVRECGEKGIGYALVFSAGFSEVGPVGAALERELADAGRASGVRIFGPNTNTNAFERIPVVPDIVGGRIGLVTQSGHNGRPIVQSWIFGIGFSRWVPTGNEVDLDCADFIEYFAHDDETAVIAGYIEGFKSGPKLRRALQAANDQDKPVVMLKIGSTAAGARMAASHTGHLTGEDAVIDGLFAQHGVTRVRDLDELLDTAMLFAKLPKDTGPNCGLYSVSGGSCTLMAEMAAAFGVPVPTLGSGTQEGLRHYLPSYLTVANPVDNGGAFPMSATPEDRRRVLDLVVGDSAVDILVVGITGANGAMSDNIARDIRQWAATAPKPVIATWNSYKTDEIGFEDLIASGVPIFRSFRNCFQSLRAFSEYRARAVSFRSRPRLSTGLDPETHLALAGQGVLEPAAARAVLESFGVPLVREVLVHSASAARAAGAELGWPVAMKIASSHLPHKSDAGLVRLSVSSAAEAAASYTALVKRARSLVNDDVSTNTVAVQEMVTNGIEMIVGLMIDPVLGPAVMVGMGGVYAEVLRDVAVRPLPLDADDGREMVLGLRGAEVLTGARGRPGADIDALVRVVLAVARLATSCDGRVSELDLNPVIVRPDGALVVDYLVVVGGEERTQSQENADLNIDVRLPARRLLPPS